MKTLLVDQTMNPQNWKYENFRVLLDLWIEWVAASMRVESPFVQKLLSDQESYTYDRWKNIDH